MTSGIVDAIAQDWRGDTLAVDAATTDLELLVDDAVDFDEDGGWLVVGEGDPLEYLSITDPEDGTPATITLADPLTEDLEAGLPVVLWDPTVPGGGSRVVEYVAAVRLSEDAGVADAVIPHEQIPVAGVENLIGATVSIEEDDEGEWWVAYVHGREPVIDGAKIDPTTLPDPSGPTEPPEESPAVEVFGTVDSLILRTEAIAASTLIEFHISTTEGFTPDETTLVAVTRANVLPVTALPDGTPLALDTTYYVRTVATNDVGSAAASDEAQGQLDPDKVTAVVAGEVIAGFVLSGRIEVGAAYWDADEGLVFPQPDGGTIRFPVDGVTAAQITAHLIARSLDVEDNANFYGLSQLLGTFRLGNGINNPTTPASASRTWEPAVAWDSPSAVDSGGKFGLAESGDGLNWCTFFNFAGLARLIANKGTGGWIVQYASGGSGLGAFTPWGGGVKIGSSYFLLGRDWDRANAWYVYKLDASTFVKQAEFAMSTSYANDPAIGSDGTNFLTAHVSNAGNILVRTYNASTGAQLGGNLNLGTPAGHPTTIRGVLRGTFDLGADRLFIADSTTTVRCYNAATAGRVAANDFPTAGNTKLVGLAWDGSRFHHLTTGASRVWAYDDGVVTDTDTDVGYTWYDAVAPEHETTEGDSVVTFTRPARSILAIETPPAPQVDVEGSDEVANQIRIYAAPSGSSLRLQATLDVGERTVQLSALDTGSANPPASNGFDGLGVTPGRIESDADDGTEKLTQIHGDGQFRFAGENVLDSGDLPASGSYSGSVRVTRIGQQVFAFGTVSRASGSSSSFHATGVTLPTWARPSSNTIVEARTFYNAAGAYRFRVNADGTVDVQQSAADNQNQILSTSWFAA